MQTFYFISDVDDPIVREFAEFIKNVPDKETVNLVIASHGGLVYLGLGVCQMIAQAQAREINFIANIYGIAASAASDIALACDKILMAEGSQIMIHSAWGGTDEGIDRANEEQLALIHKRLPDYSEKDLENDHWFDANEAVNAGLADGIIDKNSVSQAACRVAALLTPYMEDKKMADKVKAAEEIVEEEKKVDEEIEKKEEMPEAECGDREEKAEDMDLMEAIVQRLEGIEHRLAVLEGEGKKMDDEGAPSASARRKALLEKLNAVCAPSPRVESKPVAAETPQEEAARFKATYQNFDALLADFIKRK